MPDLDLATLDQDSELARAVRDFCLDGFSGPADPSAFPSVETWRQLTSKGTELWLDTGDVDAAAALWCAEFRALTTNNTLLNKEVQKGIYDEVVPVAAGLIRETTPGIANDALVLEIAFVLNARHGLQLVSRFGAQVSVELHTDLARDIDASVAYGRRYHAICPSHFIVKVPLTPEGIVAARRLADDGIPINFTLGFSARQNLLIAQAAKPSWCNVFMGRINAFVADRGLGDGKNAGERATAASQDAVAGLRKRGECETRQIGASMRGPAQVPALAGLDVYTMPAAVAQGWLDASGPIGDGLRSEFPVTFADGVDAAAERLDAFWEITPANEQAVAALASADPASLDGPGVVAALGEAGADYFPSYTPDEQARIAAGGKIPTYAPWREAVRAGRTAWDSLLTAAGLASFAADQKALDDRVRGLL